MSGRRAARQSSSSGGGGGVGGGGGGGGSGGSSSSSSSSSRITDDQIINLISKLQQLLPEIPTNSRTNRRTQAKASASKVLQETCNYIKNLHREVDDLSDRLSQLLSTIDADSAEAAIIMSLIQ